MNTYHTTNECTCTVYNEETGEDTPSMDCYGDCWESELQFWASETAPLFEALNDESEWRIDGLPLWNRNLTGTVCTDKPEELLRAVTVRGSWNLTWSVDIENLRLNLSLSHHDVPMGRSFTAEVVR